MIKALLLASLCMAAFTTTIQCGGGQGHPGGCGGESGSGGCGGGSGSGGCGGGSGSGGWGGDSGSNGCGGGSGTPGIPLRPIVCVPEPIYNIPNVPFPCIPDTPVVPTPWIPTPSAPCLPVITPPQIPCAPNTPVLPGGCNCQSSTVINVPSPVGPRPGCGPTVPIGGCGGNGGSHNGGSCGCAPKPPKHC